MEPCYLSGMADESDKLGRYPKVKVERGLVAYFDILGFTHIAADKDIARAAGLVIESLLEAQKRAEDELQPPEAVRRCFTENTRWVVFADSILILSPVLEQDPQPQVWYEFFVICAALLKLMFNAGLPLRGAISEGRFVLIDRCYVGEPIVESIGLASNTEWSGCVVSRKAAEKLQTVLSRDERYRSHMQQKSVVYQVPFKVPCAECGKPPRLVIKWFPFGPYERPAGRTAAIEERVRDRFQAHNKALSDREAKKLQNTIRFLQYVDTLYANTNEKRQIKRHACCSLTRPR